MDIPIKVLNKIAMPVTFDKIVLGESDYTITFTFDDEWLAHEVKTARFQYRKRGEKLYEDVEFVGNTVNVPMLSNISEVFVGVYVKGQRATTPVGIECINKGGLNGDFNNNSK